MKPCSRNRKRLAWLAMGLLNADEAAALRAHLDLCEGCRGYEAEIARVTRRLGTLGSPTDIETTEAFHRRVARAIQAETPRPRPQGLTEALRAVLYSWRVALPAVGALAVALVLWATSRPAPNPAPPSPRGQIATAPAEPNPPLPTLANYMATASRSLEDFDTLVSREDDHNLARFPVYRASAFALLNAQE